VDVVLAVAAWQLDIFHISISFLVSIDENYQNYRQPGLLSVYLQHFIFLCSYKTNTKNNFVLI